MIIPLGKSNSACCFFIEKKWQNPLFKFALCTDSGQKELTKANSWTFHFIHKIIATNSTLPQFSTAKGVRSGFDLKR